jgi:hypothetical protein
MCDNGKIFNSKTRDNASVNIRMNCFDGSN